MRRTIVSLASLGLVALLVAVPQALAQAEAQQEMTFEGQLVSVDATAQTLTAQDSAGEATLFYYTDDTEVAGAAADVQGISGQAGAQLRITYEPRGEMRVATRIEISAPPER